MRTIYTEYYESEWDDEIKAVLYATDLTSVNGLLNLCVELPKPDRLIKDWYKQEDEYLKSKGK